MMKTILLQISIHLDKVYAGLLGALVAILVPTLPYIAVCTLFVIADCITAFRLDRRVAKKYPQKADGKFKSKFGFKMLPTIIKIYSAIVLANCLQVVILDGSITCLPRIIAGIACGIQIWSILENESSCTDSRWAKLLQNILIDKTERHFNIDLTDLKSTSDDKSGDNK